jgi:hypothetical protein
VSSPIGKCGYNGIDYCCLVSLKYIYASSSADGVHEHLGSGARKLPANMIIAMSSHGWVIWSVALPADTVTVRSPSCNVRWQFHV